MDRADHAILGHKFSDRPSSRRRPRGHSHDVPASTSTPPTTSPPFDLIESISASRELARAADRHAECHRPRGSRQTRRRRCPSPSRPARRGFRRRCGAKCMMTFSCSNKLDSRSWQLSCMMRHSSRPFAALVHQRVGRAQRNRRRIERDWIIGSHARGHVGEAAIGLGILLGEFGDLGDGPFAVAIHARASCRPRTPRSSAFRETCIAGRISI